VHDENPVVVEIAVSQLFGRFDHRISIPAGRDFSIVVGPNGVGKTRLLELAHAALSWQVHKLIRVRFDELLLRYSDDSTFRFVQSHQMQLPEIDEHDSPPRSLVLIAELKNRESQQVPLLNDERSMRELVHLVEAAYEPSRLDPAARRFLAEARHRARNPAELLSLLDSSGIWESLAELDIEGLRPPEICEPYFGPGRSYLIETQRLVRIEPFQGLPPDFARSRPREPDGVRPQAAVTRHANDLAHRIRTAEAQSGRLGQSLDRTFPRRLLDRSRQPKEFSQIEVAYEKQRELRGRLEGIGLLDPQSDTLDLRSDLDPTELRVLQTWLDDSGEKLAAFQDLLDRIELLRTILNDKFLYKTIEVDRENGLRARSSGGEVIPLMQLSSGEQHELVLLYDLLFNVRSDSLVMIDEPELSLHVSWQRRFIEDMISVSHLRRNRFIVATHSPQIIDRWGDALIELEGGWD
jgi:ABC-type lipoprotein export system ATPase subunit